MRLTIVAIALQAFISVAPVTADPLIRESRGGLVLVESSLGALPWQRAASVAELDSVPLPADGAMAFWLERRARLTTGSDGRLLDLARLAGAGPLRGDVRLRLANALLADVGANPDAIDALLDLEPSPDLGWSYRLTAARHAARRGQAARAADHLLAALDEIEVDRLSPIDPMRDTWCEAVAEWVAPAELPQFHPWVVAECDERPPALTSGEPDAVAGALLRLGRRRYRRGDGDEARAALRRLADWSEAPPELACSGAVWLARSEARTGDDDEAERRYQWVLDHCPADRADRARALWALGGFCTERRERACAETYIGQLFAEHADDRFADDGLLVLADLYRQLDDASAEADVVELALTLPVDGDLWREVVWRGVRERLQDDPARAEDWLRRAIAAFEYDATYFTQGRFEVVLGQLLAGQDRRDEARELWREALQRYPLTFYARRACEELVSDGAPCPWPERTGPIEPADWPVDDCLAPGRRWQVLASAGLEAEAAAALAGPEHECDSARWLRALLLDRRGDHVTAHDIPRRQMTRWAQQVGGSLNDRRWAVAYPRPHLDRVRIEAERTGLEPAAVYGIMREESGFRSEVHSYAGAQGLMQLMPRTARGHAEEVDGEVTVERLADPDVNIRIGANFLAHLMGHLDNQLPLTIAAYNAGRGAVRSWLRRVPYDRGDPAAFIERIGPTQTRNYTKRVLSTREAYLYLYGE